MKKDREKIKKDFLDQLDSDNDPVERSEALVEALKTFVISYCRDDSDISIIKHVNISLEKNIKKQ